MSLSSGISWPQLQSTSTMRASQHAHVHIACRARKRRPRDGKRLDKSCSPSFWDGLRAVLLIPKLVPSPVKLSEDGLGLSPGAWDAPKPWSLSKNAADESEEALPAARRALPGVQKSPGFKLASRQGRAGPAPNC